MVETARERDLRAALFRLYENWLKLPIQPGYTRRYRAERFRQMIVPECKNYQGAVRAVQHVLTKRTLGFDRLKDYPELTVESLIASGEWDDLISEPFRKLARKRLIEISK